MKVSILSVSISWLTWSWKTTIQSTYSNIQRIILEMCKKIISFVQGCKSVDYQIKGRLLIIIDLRKQASYIYISNAYLDESSSIWSNLQSSYMAFVSQLGMFLSKLLKLNFRNISMGIISLFNFINLISQCLKSSFQGWHQQSLIAIFCFDIH